MKHIFIILFVALGLTSCKETSQESKEKTETDSSGEIATMYFGGDILTMEGEAPSYVEAVVVRSGQIEFAGEASEAMQKAGKGHRMVNLKGNTLLPGFIDGHCHFMGFGAQAIGANLLAYPDGNANNIRGVIDALKEFAQGPDSDRVGWIYGMGYDDSVLEEGRHPTRDDLDKVSTDFPVMAVHISGHFAAVNSKGLEVIGYDASTPDPEGGIIRRYPDSSEPNGVLEELAAIPFMIKLLNPSDKVNREYFMDRAQDLATSFGYTTAQEGRAFSTTHEALVEYAAEGRLEIDVVSYIDYANKSIIADAISKDYVNGYRMGGMKITLDGSPQGRTAWATLPYLIPPDGQAEGYNGYPAIPNDTTVAALYAEAMENDWQVLTHTNGDAAIDQMIRTLSPAINDHPEKDHRYVMIHGQFARQNQLDSLERLKIFPSFFAMHTYYWGDWYDQIIGEDRAQRISPTRSALDRGMILTSHTDAPVALPNPINAMHISVNRKSRSGKVMGPEERLTPYEALQAFTIWSAYQHFEEDRKGSITPGKLADLVILGANPLKVDPEGIRDIEVLETIKEGETVFRRE